MQKWNVSVKINSGDFMLINFNIEKLDKLMFDFHYLTGLSVGIFDGESRELCSYPKRENTFCRIIKSTPEGKRRCELSDKAVCAESIKKGSAVTHCCHAGLLDTAVPIKYQDTVLGFIMFGQIANSEPEITNKLLKTLSTELNLDYNEISLAHKKLEVMDAEKIEAAINIIKTATRYLWLSEYIKIEHDTFATKIDEYINEHLSETLSVKEICLHFGISKNRLYEISHKWFGKTFLAHVADARIEKAKQLLTTTDYPISRISNMVGIKDYNYFSKFFKEHTGTSPLKYRNSY